MMFRAGLLLFFSVFSFNEVFSFFQPAQRHSTENLSPQKSEKHSLVGIVEWEYKPLYWDCTVPNCDHFAFYDTVNHVNYDLDNSLLARPFEGENVKLTGYVDSKNDSIRVISIEALKK